MGKRTEIVFVLDKSGSMNSIKSDAVGGFNSFVAEQLKADGETNVTLVLFDSIVEVREGVTELTEESYVPSGMTALLDGIGIGIDNLKEDLRKHEEKDATVIFAIMTDGHENSSKEYKKERINEMIKEQTSHDWQFIFLGADMSAVDTAKGLGINGNLAGQFVADGWGTQSAMNSMSLMATSYRSTGKMMSYEDAVNGDSNE